MNSLFKSNCRRAFFRALAASLTLLGRFAFGVGISPLGMVCCPCQQDLRGGEGVGSREGQRRGRLGRPSQTHAGKHTPHESTGPRLPL